MGKIKQGILGGFSGKVGPAVGSSWKGISIVRSCPPRKRRGSTEAQLRQMAKLRLMTPFFKRITGFLNKTYDCVTVQMTCFNKALSYNMRNAIAGNYPLFEIDYPRVVLGVGDLRNPDSVSAASNAGGQILFNWPDNSGEGSARASDRAFVAVFCVAKKSWITGDPGPYRNAGAYRLEVTGFSGHPVHAYIGFLSDDAKFVSTSLYAGEVGIL
jgi:Family of unknown function (DUF6266)